MGDHRASIKIEVEMHGVKDKADMWVNWSPREYDCPGVDYRVIEFFQNWSARAMEKWDNEQWKAGEEDRERKQRETELAELARLKSKYQE